MIKMLKVMGVAVVGVILLACIYSVFTLNVNRELNKINLMGYDNQDEVRKFCYMVDISLEQFQKMPAFQKAYGKFKNGEFGDIISIAVSKKAERSANSAAVMSAASMAMSASKH